MKSKNIYAGLFLIFSFTIFAQVNKEKFYADFAKADLKNKVKLTAGLYYSDLKDVYPTIKDTLEKIRHQVYFKSKSKEAKFLFDLIDATLEQAYKNYATAVFIAENSLQNNAGNVGDSIRCYCILKHSFVKIRNFIKAYEVNAKLEKLWERKPDSVLVDYGVTKSGLYASLSFMDEAIKERRFEFIKKYPNTKDTDIIVSFYNDMGVYFNRLKLSDSAEVYFLKAKDLLNAKKFTPDKKLHYAFFKALVQGNLGLSYYNKGLVTKAVPLLREDIYHSLRYKDYESAFNSYNLMVNCCLKMQNEPLAKKYLDSAENLVNVHLKDVSPRIKFLQQASQFYQNTGDYKKANLFFEKYFYLRDSILKLENEQALLNTEVAFKIDEKERELNEKNEILKQKELNEARQKMFNAYSLVGILLLLCVIILLVLINYFSKKREKELYAKNEQINLQNTRIEQSLKEKEVLIREIHHRVKNNLQIITSMLSLQISKEEGKGSESVLREAKQRISSIALTHQMLYQNSNLSDISINEYIENLVRQIELSIPPSQIKLITELNSNNHKVNIDNAIPLGLLINELLTNSFKHAFPDNKKGIIKVTLNEVGDNCFISVSDNGIGLPDNFNLTSGKSMGMDLIHILAEQLDAKLSIVGKNGSSFILEIPKTRLYV